MLPRILWLVVGALVSLVAAVRLQLWILQHEPEAGWLAVAGGLTLAGAFWALVLVLGLRFRSLRWAGSVLILAPIIFLVLGYHGTTRYPQHHFKTADTAAEWPELHPTLRLAL